jgi:hypothetical protein
LANGFRFFFWERIHKTMAVEMQDSHFEWLTIREVADELRASVSHIKTLLGQRGGPVEIGHFKHGRRTFIKRQELERYKARVEMSATMRTPRIGR